MNTQQTTHQGQTPRSEPKGSAEDYNLVGRVIAVMSGKGGVGKSFSTGLLASGLTRRGYKVGILDADITGPSIPKLFGLHGPVEVGEYGILPLESRTGIKVISMNLLLAEEDQAVIWRGPLVSRAIKQLWGDVMWGALDVLLIDLPPGTSDATLTIMQSLPVSGLIMVTTPQSLASLVVRKAVHMAQIVNVPIIGIIENMSYYNCPDTEKKHFIFGQSHSTEVAEAAGAKIIANIPIDPEISRLCDAGDIEAVVLLETQTLMDALIQKADLPESQFEDVQLDDQIEEIEQGLHTERVAQKEGNLSKEEDLSVYSPTAQDLIQTKENMGSFDHPDLRGKVRGCCGDSIQIDLRLEGEVIQDACYITDGCYATMACGGMITRLIKGRTLTEAMQLKAKDLLTSLDGLPRGHQHCADLAIKTLREVIDGSRSERSSDL